MIVFNDVKLVHFGLTYVPKLFDSLGVKLVVFHLKVNKLVFDSTIFKFSTSTILHVLCVLYDLFTFP